MDNDLALQIYIKARATPKVVAAFAERREFDKILIYSKQVCLLWLCGSPFLVIPDLELLFSRLDTLQIISSSCKPFCGQIHR